MNQIVIVPRTSAVPLSKLVLAAAAMSRQVSERFEPFWQSTASVAAVGRAEDLPSGAWPIFLAAHGNEGVHAYDQARNTPVATVGVEDSWDETTVTLSHEVLEMIADESGQTPIRGPSPVDGASVQFPPEVCDPCEAISYAKPLDGIVLSDFVTPDYYDPTAPVGSVFSAHGFVNRPFEILPGGYLTWHTSSGWWQQTVDRAGNATTTRLGSPRVGRGNMRGATGRLAGGREGRPIVADATDRRAQKELRAVARTQRAAMAERGRRLRELSRSLGSRKSEA